MLAMHHIRISRATQDVGNHLLKFATERLCT